MGFLKYSQKLDNFSVRKTQKRVSSTVRTVFAHSAISMGGKKERITLDTQVELKTLTIFLIIHDATNAYAKSLPTDCPLLPSPPS